MAPMVRPYSQAELPATIQVPAGNTLKGGVAPDTARATASTDQKATVKYQADYIFWKAA